MGSAVCSDRPARAARLPGLVAAGVMLLLTCAAGTATATSANVQAAGDVVSISPAPVSYATDVQSYINAERRRYGLVALGLDSRLNAAAQNHANDMAARNRMTHTGSDGSNGGTRITRAGYRWSSWGENVAYGYTTARSVVSAWLQSPPHRANMLNGGFRHMGLGVARAANGTMYWCLVLASPR